MGGAPRGGERDPTAHAEMCGIREVCARVGDFSLEGSIIYSSCEPCPMCLAAIYRARIERPFYANMTADAAAVFREWMTAPNRIRY